MPWSEYIGLSALLQCLLNYTDFQEQVQVLLITFRTLHGLGSGDLKDHLLLHQSPCAIQSSEALLSLTEA